MFRLDVGINSVVGVGFGLALGWFSNLEWGWLLFLALFVVGCDVMGGIGLVRMMLWEALRVVVRERQDRCIDRIDGYFYFYSCSMVDFQIHFYSYAPQGDALQQGT